LGGFGPSDVDDCWSFNFGNFGSSGNLGNLFSGHAMTALLGDLGDSSLSRLPIYSIAKSAMAIPAILFPAVIPCMTTTVHVK
jgi:hypothetical protein